MPSRLLVNGEWLPVLCKCPEICFIRLFRLGRAQWLLSPLCCYRRGVWGLASCCSKARLVERKVYFRCQPLGVGEGWAGGYLSRGRLPTLATSGARAFIDRRRGLHAETAESALTFIFRLVIGSLISITLVVLGTVNLQSQGPFVPISLRPVLGIVAAYVMVIR